MLFNQFPTYSPLPKQDFIWVAEYVDGTYLAEYDFKTGVHNEFLSIRRQDLLRFGLVGMGCHVYYELYGGTFNILGKLYEFSYVTDGVEYALTGRSMMYNDLIHYKKSSADIPVHALITEQSGTLDDQIDLFGVGYKMPIVVTDTKISFKSILKIPYQQPLLLSARVVMDRDAPDGVLIVRKNGKVIDTIDAPLRKDIGSEIDWVVL